MPANRIAKNAVIPTKGKTAAPLDSEEGVSGRNVLDPSAIWTA